MLMERDRIASTLAMRLTVWGKHCVRELAPRKPGINTDRCSTIVLQLPALSIQTVCSYQVHISPSLGIMNSITSHLILQSVPLDAVSSDVCKVLTSMSFLHPRLDSVTGQAKDGEDKFHTSQTPKYTGESFHARTR